MAHLSLSLLGPFQATLDGQPVLGFKSNKVRALLAYLAVEADRPHRRETLAGLLWPDWPDPDALSNLRYALSNLRRAINDRVTEPPYLLISRDSLQFNALSDHRVDVANFVAEAETDADDPKAVEKLQAAGALYRGIFLEGFSIGDSPAFEEWALLTRERLARLMVSALRRLGTVHEQQGEYEQAQECARRQLEMEPWDEASHRQLMRALTLAGRRGSALAQYEACQRVLAEGLGVEPSEETERLYELIRAGGLRSSVPAPTREGDAWPFSVAKRDLVSDDTPSFVAREREMAHLSRLLDLALDGRGRVAFVTGEAGSGKTTLVQEFSRRAQGCRGDLIVASGNCNAYTGIGDPYLPFREIFELLTGDVEARLAAGSVTVEHAARLQGLFPVAAQALVEVGPGLIDTFVQRAALRQRALASTRWPERIKWLARLEDVGESRQVSGPAGSHQTDLFAQYARVLSALARSNPLLLVVDDLQWADPGSISLLFQLGRSLTGSRILIVSTYRPEEVALGRHDISAGADGRARHPLETVVNEFQRSFGDTTVNLGEAQSWEFVQALVDSEPNALGKPFREMVHRQTRGNPLFAVELLRGMQERGDLVQDSEGRWTEGPELNWQRLPSRVEAAIAERVERLADPLRSALRVASVEGETFTAEVVAQVLEANEEEIIRHLSVDLTRRHRLVRAEGIERIGGRRLSRYRFRHILAQRYLYSTLDEVERALYHQAVGEALETLRGDREDPVAAGDLAHHFERAAMTGKAIGYLRQAGERAAQISAYQESAALLGKALDLLTELPDSRERALQELDLQLSLGVAHMGGSWTFDDMESAYGRARELSLQTGRVSQLCHTLGQLVTICYLRGENRRALELAEESLRMAERSGDRLLEAVAHWRVAYVSYALGDFAGCRTHLEPMMSLYEPAHHSRLVYLCGSNSGVSAFAYDACCLWCLGYPEQAHEQGERAFAMATEIAHPFSMGEILLFAGCMLSQMRQDAPALTRYAEELAFLAAEEQLPTWASMRDRYVGTALAIQGQYAEAIGLMRKGIEADKSREVVVQVPTTLCSIAEAQALAGAPQDGLGTLAEASAMVDRTDEKTWAAEIHRVRASCF